MDQTGNQKKQSLSQIIKSQIHKKLTRLLLSVSVFSLFFSLSYWISLFQYSFNLNLHNTLPFQLFTHTIDKNCMFLLCNGLLVFLLKYSGLISSSSKYSNLSDDQSFESYEDVPQSEANTLEANAPLSLDSADQALENSVVMEGGQEEGEEEEAENAERETGNLSLEEKEKEDGDKWGLMTVAEEEDEEEENADIVEEDEGEVKGSDSDLSGQKFEESENYDRDYEDEVELVEGNTVLSTEELNKKFDEFIRKMKEELRIEARQQLVMV